MHAFALGASKNLGYHATFRLLKKGYTVTLLLRSTSVFDNDEQMQPFVRNGKAQLVRGDALNKDDVRKGWEAAIQAGGGKVDAVLFAIGGRPSFSMSRGLALDPPGLCTASLLNVLTTIPDSLRAPETQPRFVIITALGITSEMRAELPLVLKPIYSVFLRFTMVDKLGIERAVAHCAGWPWTSKDEPANDVLPPGWQSTPGLLGQGELKHVVIVRPAALTDGECRGDEAGKTGQAPYRTSKDTTMSGAYTVSRQDVAHFVVEDVLPRWSEWEGSGVALAY
ncbi:hypothetical protein C8T65DRAFT_582797 [Cerioporus squamosus]|nr:hypothetical protein C8T65DRAFT_582797 [Cerioporus squamosus]